MDPFLGEIRMLACNFPPSGWAFCNGQLLPISRNTALFSLLGTTYGGDGKSTFALPNLQGSAALHAGIGAGPGLQDYTLGEVGGTPNVTLLTTEIPSHTHQAVASSAGADQASPTGNVWAVSGSRRTTTNVYASTSSPAPMNPLVLNIAGGSLPHNNMHPYLALNFCIALQGVFPARP